MHSAEFKGEPKIERGVREAQLHDLHKGGESLVGGSAGAGSMEQKQWLEVWARGSVAAAIGVLVGVQAVYARYGRRCVECWGRCARVTASHTTQPGAALERPSVLSAGLGWVFGYRPRFAFFYLGGGVVLQQPAPSGAQLEETIAPLARMI